MSICTSPGNSAPAKRVWIFEGQMRNDTEYRSGALINSRNKLSVYTTPCLYACMLWFKKKRKARCLVDRFHNLKSNLLYRSWSHVNPIDFSIGLPKLDRTYLHLPNYFYFCRFCNVRNFNIYQRTNVRYNCLEHHRKWDKVLVHYVTCNVFTWNIL